MNENKNDSILGLSPKNIKMDLLLFKDDILKDIRNIQKSLDSKYLKAEENLTSKITKFESKISIFEQTIFELSKKISINSDIIENIDTLNKFKEETSDTIFKRRAKFNEFQKRIDEEINRINDILIDSVIYPGIIGQKAKFKTFHEYIDYTLEAVGQLKTYKEKTGLDLGPFKKKIDQSIEAFKLQLTNISNISKAFTVSSVEQCEERIKSTLKIYDDRLQDSRVENSHYTMGIEKKTNELKDKINKLQNAVNKKFGMKGYDNLEDTFNYYNNEIIELNNKINKLHYIIKELLLLFNKNKTKDIDKGKIYSGVKQYIKGALKADQLSAMKSFKKYENSSFGENIKKTNTAFNKKNNILINDINNLNNKYNHIINNRLSKKSLSNRKIEKYDSKVKSHSTHKNHEIRDLYHALNFINKSNDFNLNKNDEIQIEKKMTFNKSNIKKFNEETELKKDEKIRKKEEKKKTDNRKRKNSLKLTNSSISSDEQKNSILNFSEESKDDNNMSGKTNSKNEYVIKEEDENNISDNSFLKIKGKKEQSNKDKKDNIDNKTDKLNDKELKINNNSYNNLDKTGRSNSKKYTYKIGLNSLKKNNDYKNTPLLEILNYGTSNDKKKTRCQSSKKGSINNLKLFHNNKINVNYTNSNATDKKKKRDSKIIINSYNNTYINTNYQMNREYNNFPFIDKDIIGHKLETVSNFAKNRNMKKTGYNKSNHIEQTYNNTDRIKKIKDAKIGSKDNLLFSNAVIAKKSNKMFQNKNIGIGYERNNEAKQIQNLYNKLQSYIPQY